MRISRLPRLAGRGLVKVYRYTLSPLVGFHCRHLPTCSEYADEALDRYGLWAGGWMTLARLLRCQPWGTSGIDRVPEVLRVGDAVAVRLADRAVFDGHVAGRSRCGCEEPDGPGRRSDERCQLRLPGVRRQRHRAE